MSPIARMKTILYPYPDEQSRSLRGLLLKILSKRTILGSSQDKEAFSIKKRLPQNMIFLFQHASAPTVGWGAPPVGLEYFRLNMLVPLNRSTCHIPGTVYKYIYILYTD